MWGFARVTLSSGVLARSKRGNATILGDGVTLNFVDVAGTRSAQGLAKSRYLFVLMIEMARFINGLRR